MALVQGQEDAQRTDGLVHDEGYHRYDGVALYLFVLDKEGFPMIPVFRGVIDAPAYLGTGLAFCILDPLSDLGLLALDPVGQVGLVFRDFLNDLLGCR